MATPKEHGIALLMGPYGREIGNLASNYTAPLFWFSPAPNSQIGHGCIFLLDLGHGIFGVTANHVYEAYLERRKADPRVRCQIGDCSFVPEKRLIDCDRALDIATFRFEVGEIPEGKIIHQALSGKWPPRPPDLNRGLFFAGYPRAHRKVVGEQQIEWGTYVGILTATSVSQRDVTCQFRREEMVDMFGTGEPPQGQWLGGLSGTPLWTLVQTTVFSWRLAGIVCEFNTEYELLLARRPDVILSNGKLAR